MLSREHRFRSLVQPRFISLESEMSPDEDSAVGKALNLALTVLGVLTMLALSGFGLAFGLKGRSIKEGNRLDSLLAPAGVL